MSLFLFDGYYFDSMTAAPSGLMSYIGCFLIQFFHYPLLGAAIYVALLYAVYALVRKVFDIPAKYSLLALLPSVALLASDTQLGYWLFMLKLPGYYYVALVATVVSLLAMWLYKKLSPVWRMPLMLVWAVAGYPVMGVYALCATLIMALMGLDGIDKLGEYSRRGCLADPSRSAEKIGMRKLTAKDGILQGLSYIVLTDKGPEGVRSVFSCRYYILSHKRSLVITDKDRHLFCNFVPECT